MTNNFAIVLAAGQGTRMKSKLYKVLHPVCGKPMVEHVVDNIKKLNVNRIVTIVGYGAEKVQEYLGEKSEYALQAEQLGTAHAVMQAEEILGQFEGTTFVVCGDTPLIRTETFENLYKHHIKSNAKATILTAIADNPTGYGRIIRDSDGKVSQIVEQKDATVEQQKIKEINTGTYCFDNKALFEALKLVNNENAQGEYYLTDVIEILQSKGEIVSAFVCEDFDETLGVNDRVALSQAEEIMRNRIIEQHMKNGVTIINPVTTHIQADVEIGRDTIIKPGVIIEGKTTIGEDCIIGPNSHIVNSIIGNQTTIQNSVVTDSKVGDDTAVGPFAHIRPSSNIGSHVKIGNFVEVKKSALGDDTKVSHLSYIGDATVGKNVNVGCGSITVNYDGKNKFETIIEDNVFVGCNTNLVAPVKVGEGSFIAAGSTITKDVPQDALAIARARQENKLDYAKKFK